MRRRPTEPLYDRSPGALPGANEVDAVMDRRVDVGDVERLLFTERSKVQTQRSRERRVELLVRP